MVAGGLKRSERRIGPPPCAWLPSIGASGGGTAAMGENQEARHGWHHGPSVPQARQASGDRGALLHASVVITATEMGTATYAPIAAWAPVLRQNVFAPSTK
jgi:hypothetical protein